MHTTNKPKKFFRAPIERMRQYAEIVRNIARQVDQIYVAVRVIDHKLEVTNSRMDNRPGIAPRPANTELPVAGPTMTGDQARDIVERTLYMVRQEYTVMPRFGFHQPLNYLFDTFPVKFEPPVVVPDEPLPLPPVSERMGYSADNEEYLSWGRYDKELVEAQLRKHHSKGEDISILDFGCSSGRVLRHFYENARRKRWKLHGVDIQARPIQWMRENFTNDFCVSTGTVQPHLHFADNHFDVVYGVSVFTHIKFLWDAWLLELRRVLKPGGLLIQTFHSEHAWNYYYQNRDQDWVRNNHSPSMLLHEQMPHDYFYYGDISMSQVFWKREVARKFWSRYLEVIEILPPPPKWSFQDWIICRKQS
jgi:SAM-dependent methyltransferase